MFPLLFLLVINIADAGKNELPLPTVIEDEDNLPIIPTRYAKWCEVPQITVCRGSGLDPDTVADAFDFLNQPYTSVEKGKCECNIRLNEIQFGADKCFDLKEGVDHGRTLLMYHGECMVGSVVGIRTDEPIVLTHEAGHAIGWMHSRFPQHLMFPYYENAGWMTVGME